MALNELSISCDGSQMPYSTAEADIVSFVRMYQLPSPEQVRMGLDMNNFKPVASGHLDVKAHEYSAIEIKGLADNSTYAVFAVLYTSKNDMDIYSLKNETAQMVVKTLSRSV
jgi:hypothetical protein